MSSSNKVSKSKVRLRLDDDPGLGVTTGEGRSTESSGPSPSMSLTLPEDNGDGNWLSAAEMLAKETSDGRLGDETSKSMGANFQMKSQNKFKIYRSDY